jgi:hypothetical protein
MCFQVRSSTLEGSSTHIFVLSELVTVYNKKDSPPPKGTSSRPSNREPCTPHAHLSNAGGWAVPAINDMATVSICPQAQGNTVHLVSETNRCLLRSMTSGYRDANQSCMMRFSCGEHPVVDGVAPSHATVFDRDYNRPFLVSLLVAGSALWHLVLIRSQSQTHDSWSSN